MSELRGRIIAMLVWFAALLWMDSAGWPLGISNSAIGCSIAAAAATVGLPRQALRHPRGLMAGAVFGFLLFKTLLGGGIGGASVATTMVEAAIVAASILAARPAARGVVEIEESVFQTMISHLEDPSLAHESRQADMYSEIRRARHYDHPVSMIALSLGDTPEADMNRLVERIQREQAQRYAEVQLVDLLAEETRESDVIVRRGDSIFALLAETDGREAELFAGRLAAAASHRLGIEVRIGSSSFPDECVTLEKLLEVASNRLDDPHSTSVPRGGSSSGPRKVDPKVAVQRAESA